MVSPLQSFLGGQERALGIQQQQLSLDQSRQAAPQLAAQRDLSLQRQKLGLSEDQMGVSLKQAQLLNNALDAIQKLPEQQRFDVARRLQPELQKFGINLPEFGPEQLTDQALQGHKAALVGFVQNPEQALTAAQREFQSLTAGLSPEEKEEARRIELGLSPRAVGSSKITTATTPELTRQVAQSEQEIKEATKRGEGIAKTERLAIDEGRDAAKGIPVLRRTLELLDLIRTGGFQTALIRARQTFGVEGADEGELTANLGQAVLGDLRATFGAAFTEREGARLERIRANLGRSTIANRRLVAQALKLAESAAERAIDDAIDAGDIRTAEEIQSLLDLTLESEPDGTQQDFGDASGTPDGTTAVNPQTGQRIIVRQGRWVSQ